MDAASLVGCGHEDFQPLYLLSSCPPHTHVKIKKLFKELWIISALGECFCIMLKTGCHRLQILVYNSWKIYLIVIFYWLGLSIESN